MGDDGHGLVSMGLDDIYERESSWFGTKREAQENLLFRFMIVLNEMAREIGE